MVKDIRDQALISMVPQFLVEFSRQDQAPAQESPEQTHGVRILCCGEGSAIEGLTGQRIRTVKRRECAKQG
jgi:hypothetical protein